MCSISSAFRRRGVAMKWTVSRIASGEAKAMVAAVILAVVSAVGCTTAAAANVGGQVLGGGAPIANSTVTLFAANTGNPRQLGQARTGADGRFSINAPSAPSG